VIDIKQDMQSCDGTSWL